MRAARVPPERGLRGTITTRGERVVTRERQDPAIIFHELRLVAQANSYTATWEGWLEVEQAGEHETLHGWRHVIDLGRPDRDRRGGYA